VFIQPAIRRVQAPLAGTVFERRALLFYAVLLVLLAFFAIAAVHELIPGLCEADGEGEEDCPFCKLVHTLTLIVAVFFFFTGCTAIRNTILSDSAFSPLMLQFPAYRLRAPPLS
jgi:hypothetical protein